MAGKAADPLLADALVRIAADVDSLFDALLPVPQDTSARLIEAMRYATIGGGKRLRPLLLTATAAMYGVDRAPALRAAIAVEAIHAYSLIHDDLPCMDDDALRHGKPTTHLAFDEATAVLAGDALHAFAFEVLADPLTSGDPFTRIELVATLGAAVEMGAVLGKVPAEGRLHLRGYARDIGLAFQIADDLLDHEGDEAAAGKALRKDEAAGKQTFLTLLGPDRARDQARMLVEQAIAHLGQHGAEADLLRAIARYIVERDH